MANLQWSTFGVEQLRSESSVRNFRKGVMKPAEYPVGHYLEDTVQVHVPAYQRPYSWEADRHVDLWRDVANEYRKAQKGASGAHFMGAVILEKVPATSTTGVSPVMVIDGQQRVLTLLVLLATIRDHMAVSSKKRIPEKNDLDLISPKFGKSVPRVVPKAQDAAVLRTILRGKYAADIPDDQYDHPLSQAYRFFRFQLWQGKSSVMRHTLNLPPRPQRGKAAPPRGSFDPWGPSIAGVKALDLPLLYSVITGNLRILELMLEASDEEAGVIFETMNAKGTPLRQFDLLRNSIFVRMPRQMDKFYKDVWQYVEESLHGVSYRSLRDKPEDQFFYEYVIAAGEAGVSKDSLHRRWLANVIEDVGYEVTATSEKKFKTRHVDPLVNAAFLYPIAVGQKRTILNNATGTKHSVSPENEATIKEIMAMSGGPLVPLILRALTENVTDRELSEMLQDLQSFLVRLILGNEDFSPLRATMMVVASKLKSPVTPAGLRDALRSADWKTDSEILTVVKELQTSAWSSAVFFPILRGIERQLSGISAHAVPFGNKPNQFSIEHIYPQTANIGPKWDADLRAWKVNRDRIDSRRYALGNLTAVTGYDNRVNGRKPFGDKQKLIGKTASLKLHDSFISAPNWTPARIDARAILLAKAALARWPRS